MNGCDISCLYIDLHSEPLLAWERVGGDMLLKALRTHYSLHLCDLDMASEPYMWAYAKRFMEEAKVALVLIRAGEDEQALKLAVTRLLAIRRPFVLALNAYLHAAKPLKNAELVLADNTDAVLLALERQADFGQPK